MNDKLRRQRLPLVKELFALGFTYKKIASSVGCSVSTVTKDLLLLGREKFKNRLIKRQTVFQSALRLRAGIGAKDIKPNDRLAEILKTHLKEDEILAFISGIILTMEQLNRPAFKPEQENYYNLMAAIFGSPKPIEANPYQVWQQYLQEIAQSKIATPKSHFKLRQELIDIIIPACRELIKPIWPNNLPAKIEEQINTLRENEQEVIRLRFGLGAQRLTLEQVAQKKGVTQQRVRQIEAKALRKLRHPSRSNELRPFILPISEIRKELDKLLEEWKKAKEGMVALRLSQVISTDEIGNSINILPQLPVLNSESALFKLFLRKIDDLELSTRTYNALKGTGIYNVGQLVQLTEKEILRLKNFGYKSLNEIKFTLEYGLTLKSGLEPPLRLGLKFSPELKRQLEVAAGGN